MNYKPQAVKLPKGATNIKLAKPEKGSWIVIYEFIGQTQLHFKEIVLTNEKQKVSLAGYYILEGITNFIETKKEMRKDIANFVQSCIDGEVTSPVLVVVKIEE